MENHSGNNSLKRDVEVITTHVNADFDALASMLAAAKLYPQAMLVFPGAQERNLRNFYVESVCYFYNFVKVKNVPFERVKRLILVDTRQKDRIGPLAKLLDDPEVEIHAYDHHPDSENDVKTDLQRVEMVGATVTLLSGLLQENGVLLGEDEATILSLGIYEDTGSFTFSSTTQEDYRAAAWLLGQGANLNVVSSLITRELTAEEVGLLNDLIRSAQEVVVNGVTVVISEVSRERYVPDFAVLVHKFMDMDNLNVLFALARMEGRVYLVARSRLPEVDAGVIAKALGGGGHPTAASATLRDMTLVEARDRLKTVLQTRINPTRTAADLMTSPVVAVEADASLAEAHDVLTRYDLDVLPILKEGKVIGIIQRPNVEKALVHKLEKLPVTEYMDTRVEAISPSDGLGRVEQALVAERQRLVAVMDQGRLAGVITRTDLLNHFFEQPLMDEQPVQAGEEAGQPRFKSIKGLMRERFPKRVSQVLMEMGRVAEEMGHAAYLVGGSVRDLFLRRDNLDLDVVIEGDGVAFIKRFAEGRQGLRTRIHQKFNTGKLIWDDGLIIDVATARLEYYKSPASLPTVELSSIKLDLYRRDFTINTLAVRLNPKQFGQLFDFFDGMRDIKEKVIRVLHNLSFVEDPTRVFRAVRFEQRFGFRIGKLTEGLIKNAIKIEAFLRLSGSRLFGELRQILDEERALDCVKRLMELKLLREFHPNLKLEDKDLGLWNEIQDALAWYQLSFLDQPIRQWVLYFLPLVDNLTDEELGQMGARLSLAPKLRNEIIGMRKEAQNTLNQMQRARPAPSVVYGLLQGLKPEYQLYIMAKATRDWVKRSVSKYLTTLKQVRPELGGDDLMAMGFEPGPVFRQILERLLAARLDGEVKDRDGEQALVRAEFGKEREALPK
ncbi:polya polymerase [Desulfocarbo indianensis]|nr:polya polymerase [Desulfocarbo indianensis]